MYFITSNDDKFQEAKKQFPTLKQYSLDITEIQSLDLKKIVQHKLAQAYNSLKKPCIVEDTSLELADLQGMPGPFIKYFAKALGQEGIARIANTSAARAVCCIGYHDGTTTHYFFGDMKGTITTPKGRGFGFDVIFIPENKTLRISELSPEYKNMYSHRARALKQLKEYLNG